jgi:lipopolysaccharide/colanic/teichoic acid biosynthesis glycosyltransferase
MVDVLLAALALVVLSPFLVLAAAGIRLGSPGPVFYRASRVGRHGRKFTMYKFRTMHVTQHAFSSLITARDDPRVFRFGSWLRRLKIDELPQLINIVKGDMAFIGPRPEDPEMVQQYYKAAHWETLSRLPGLSSPGSLYYYTHLEQTLGRENTERWYGEQVLPTKLALDIIYVREASGVYDFQLVLRTAWVIFAMAAGKRWFPEPSELAKARQLGLIAPPVPSAVPDRDMPAPLSPFLETP